MSYHGKPVIAQGSGGLLVLEHRSKGHAQYNIENFTHWSEAFRFCDTNKLRAEFEIDGIVMRHIHVRIIGHLMASDAEMASLPADLKLGAVVIRNAAEWLEEQGVLLLTRATVEGKKGQKARWVLSLTDRGRNIGEQLSH